MTLKTAIRANEPCLVLDNGGYVRARALAVYSHESVDFIEVAITEGRRAGTFRTVTAAIAVPLVY